MRLGLGISIPGTTGLVAAAFSPLDLSPVLWLDAADTSTITESGGSVSQWDNKGSLGDFTQGTAALQPTTGATTQNGMNVVDFAADYLNSADAASAYNDLHNGEEYIVAAVVKFGTTANPNAFYPLLGNNAGTGNKVGIFLSYEDRTSIPADDRIRALVTNAAGAANAPINNSTADGFFPGNTMGILSSLQDPDNATAADRSQVALNAGSLVGNNTNTGTVSASDAAHVLQVGSVGDASGVLTGSIAELVIVTGANAIEANRVKLRDYLNNKWSVY